METAVVFAGFEDFLRIFGLLKVLFAGLLYVIALLFMLYGFFKAVDFVYFIVYYCELFFKLLLQGEFSYGSLCLSELTDFRDVIL